MTSGKVINLRYISDALPEIIEKLIKHKTVIIESPLGTGKTYKDKLLIKSLREQGYLNESSYIRVVVYSNILVKSITKDLSVGSGANFLTHLEVKEKNINPDEPNVVSSINSLSRVTTKDRKVDLLIIDEPDFILNAIAFGTVSERNETLEFFKKVITGCKYLIVNQYKISKQAKQFFFDCRHTTSD